MRFGLDSTSMISPAAHHAAGSTVALRYLSRYTAKVVTKAEPDQYRHHGIDLVLVFEDGARNAWEGYDKGKADAEFAVNQAHSILGTPKMPTCIRFAVDDDVAGHPEATDAYFDGVAAVLHRANCGPYGSYEVVAHHHARNFGQLWQTYAWSGGRVFTGASVFQYSNDHTVGGVGCDFNHINGRDFGQFDRPVAGDVDPHGYRLFDSTPKMISNRWVTERGTVVEYDRLRVHPLLHARRLGQLRVQLRWFADRLWLVAHAPGNKPAINWTPFHRGWRYQQIAKRAQGQRLV